MRARPNGPRPPERDYSGRDVVDKLGIKLGHVVAFDEVADSLDAELKQRILDRAVLDTDAEGDPIDVVLALADTANWSGVNSRFIFQFQLIEHAVEPIREL